MNKLRKKLHKCIEEHGINSDEALRISRELDLLIVKEQHSLVSINRMIKQAVDK